MRLPGKVIVVLDILFATTTMVTVLAHGATQVVPVVDQSAARKEAGNFPEGSLVLAGELYAETLPGFAHPAPLALIEHGVRGKTVVYSTTNGTVAMTQAAGAAQVYCGAMLNVGAHRRAHRGAAPADTVVSGCAGSGNKPQFRGFLGRRLFVERLAAVLGAAADRPIRPRPRRRCFTRHLADALLDCRWAG